MVRTFAPFVAGVAQITFARFVSVVFAGAAIWVVTLVGGGYYFGNVPIIHGHMSEIVLFGLTIGVGSLVVSGAWRYFKARRPVLAPMAASGDFSRAAAKSGIGRELPLATVRVSGRVTPPAPH